MRKTPWKYLLGLPAVGLLIPIAASRAAGADSPRFDAEEARFWGEEEVLITATLYEAPLRMTPVIANVISADKIRDMGARDINDVLVTLPGLDVVESPTAVGLNNTIIRGWGLEYASEVLFMIDGHRLNTVAGGEPLGIYDDMMVDNIKRIEVIRGPVSSLYGADAMSGVVNIITRDWEDVEGLEMTFSGGSWETYQGNLMYGRKMGELGIFCDINYLNSEGPHLQVDRDSIYGQPASRSPGLTRYNREKADIDLKLGYENLIFKGRYTWKRNGPYVGVKYALNEDSRLTREQFFGELSYEDRLFSEAGFLLKAYGGRFSSDSYFQVFPGGFSAGPYIYPDGPINEINLKNRSLGAEGRLIFDVPRDNRLIIGILSEWRYQYDVATRSNYNPLTLQPYPDLEDISDWANFNQDENRRIFALFLEDDWALDENFNLMAGIRYDRFSDVGDAVNPRAGLTWRCLADTYLKLIYGEAFRPPSFLELYSQNNRFLEGNPDLEAEKVRTWQAGLEHNFSEGIKARLNYFQSYFRDLITLEPAGALMEPRKFVNTGRVDSRGVEAELRGSWGNNYAFLNYSYQYARDRDTGEGLANIPAHKANLGVNIEMLDYFNANATVIIRGKRQRSDGDSREDLSAYGLVNLSLTARNFWKNLVLQATVYNLFDKQYHDPSPAGTMESDLPREGRSFLLTARYSF